MTFLELESLGFVWGAVELYNHEWECIYKFYDGETIAMYCEIDGYEVLQYTSYKSLVADS